MDHSIYDKRKYPIVDAQHGYTEWSRTYEQVVEDAMDLRLFERLHSVGWSAARQVLDLACGTGRIGAWLKGHTSAPIDGVDFTPAVTYQSKVFFDDNNDRPELQQPPATLLPDFVQDEFQKGYMLNDRLLRPISRRSQPGSSV